MATLDLPYPLLHGLEDAQSNFEWLSLKWPTVGSGATGPSGPAGPQGPAGTPGANGGAATVVAIGDGVSQAFTVTHGLGTSSVQVTVYRTAVPYDEVEADVEHTDANTVTIRTTLVPALNEYTVVCAGPGATGGGGGSDAYYVYDGTGTPATSWTVTHNLGKFPSVSVVDTGGNWLLPDVHYVNTNQLTVSLASPTTGKAYMN